MDCGQLRKVTTERADSTYDWRCHIFGIIARQVVGKPEVTDHDLVVIGLVLVKKHRVFDHSIGAKVPKPERIAAVIPVLFQNLKLEEGEFKRSSPSIHRHPVGLVRQILRTGVAGKSFGSRIQAKPVAFVGKLRERVHLLLD